MTDPVTSITYTIPELVPNEEVGAYIFWTYSAPGTYSATITVDKENKFLETNTVIKSFLWERFLEIYGTTVCM